MSTPYKIMVVAPNYSPTSRLPSYDYTQAFLLEKSFIGQNFGYKDNFFVVTAENFLSRMYSANTSGPSYIRPLSLQQFSQVNSELFRCSRIYINAHLITNSFVETSNSDFYEQLNDELGQWRLLPNNNLYPYFPNVSSNIETPLVKQNKIRNTAANFGAGFGQMYQYNMSTHFYNSTTRLQTKGMYLGNYYEDAKDILNLNIQDPSYKSNISVENMGPYYANGYPNILTALDDINYYSMIGQDCLNLWDISKIKEYTDNITNPTPAPGSPLIIQCDPYSFNTTKSGTVSSQVSPINLFNSLFARGGTVTQTTGSGTGSYPQTIAVTTGGDQKAQQEIILNFLKKVPYILFAGINLDVNTSPQPKLGGFYSYSGTVNNQSTFVLDTILTGSGQIPLSAPVNGLLDPLDPSSGFYSTYTYSV